MQNIDPDEEVHTYDPRWGEWTEDHKRTLLITFLGGLAANVGLAMMIGLVFAMIRLSSRHGTIYAIFYYIAWFVIGTIAAVTVGFLDRTFASRPSHWRSWFLYAGVMAFVFYFGYAIQISK